MPNVPYQLCVKQPQWSINDLEGVGFLPRQSVLRCRAWSTSCLALARPLTPHTQPSVDTAHVRSPCHVPGTVSYKRTTGQRLGMQTAARAAEQRQLLHLVFARGLAISKLLSTRNLTQSTQGKQVQIPKPRRKSRSCHRRHSTSS